MSSFHAEKATNCARPAKKWPERLFLLMQWHNKNKSLQCTYKHTPSHMLSCRKCLHAMFFACVEGFENCCLVEIQQEISGAAGGGKKNLFNKCSTYVPNYLGGKAPGAVESCIMPPCPSRPGLVIATKYLTELPTNFQSWALAVILNFFIY